MTTSGYQLAKAASEFIGIPFRLHGRDPASGLDCVGLIALSLARIGRPVSAPTGYGLRNTNISRWLKYAETAGLIPANRSIEAGDIILARPAPAQHHLMIADGRTCAIHAHAGIRRVVRQPLAQDFEPFASWRLAD